MMRADKFVEKHGVDLIGRWVAVAPAGGYPRGIVKITEIHCGAWSQIIAGHRGLYRYQQIGVDEATDAVYTDLKRLYDEEWRRCYES